MRNNLKQTASDKWNKELGKIQKRPLCDTCMCCQQRCSDWWNQTIYSHA